MDASVSGNHKNIHRYTRSHLSAQESALHFTIFCDRDVPGNWGWCGVIGPHQKCQEAYRYPIFPSSPFILEAEIQPDTRWDSKNTCTFLLQREIQHIHAHLVCFTYCRKEMLTKPLPQWNISRGTCTRCHRLVCESPQPLALTARPFAGGRCLNWRNVAARGSQKWRGPRNQLIHPTQHNHLPKAFRESIMFIDFRKSADHSS